ncbi:MAG: hypothetical protein ACREFK_20775 [Stellaceae bacterium]
MADLAQRDQVHPNQVHARKKYCRLQPTLARRLVVEIGPLDGLKPAPAGLLDRIGHRPPLAIPHRGQA